MNQQTVIRKLGVAKLLLLGLASFLLSNTVIMGVFSPLPMVIAIMLYGRLKGYAMTVLTLGFSLFLLWQGFAGPDLKPEQSVALMLQLSYFTMFLLITIFSAETVLRSWKPTKVITLGGIFTFLFVLATVSLSFSYFDLTTQDLISGYLESNKAEIDQVLQEQNENFEAMALLSQPEKLAGIVNQEFPRVLFLMTMFSFWANMALTLKAKRLTVFSQRGYSEHDVIHFKVIDSLVYVLIASLVLYLAGDSFLDPATKEIGKTFLYICGTFYFFKGFGVFINFLDLLAMVGFLRTIMVIFTIVLFKELVAFIGLFDIWFNFNGKILNKMNNNSN